MQILKKKINIINNNLDNYQIYLKNLNFFNKFKNKNKILLKDSFLLKLKGYYLLNINLKENFFFENIKNFDYKKKENLHYSIVNRNNKEILINSKYINYFIINLYNYFFFKKFKKYQIKKYIIKKNNNEIKEIYYKKTKNIFPYIKGKILKYKGLKKNIDKKYIVISFYGLIKEIKSYYLYKKKNNPYFIKSPFLKRKYKRKSIFKNVFKKFKKKNKFFLINNFKINNNNILFNSSRKNFVFDFNKKNNLKKYSKLENLNNLKKYSKLFIEK
jgi:hypothetical protein